MVEEDEQREGTLRASRPAIEGRFLLASFDDEVLELYFVLVVEVFVGEEPALEVKGCVCGTEPECQDAGDVGVRGCSEGSGMPVVGE